MLHSCQSNSPPIPPHALGRAHIVAPLHRRRAGLPVDVPAPLAIERLDVRLPTAALLHRASHTLVVGVGLDPRPLHVKVHVNTVKVSAVTGVARVRRLGERRRGRVLDVAREHVIEEVEVATALGVHRRC